MSIKELIQLYAARKQAEKEAKDACSAVTTEVKKYMTDNGMEEAESGEWKVTYKPSERVSMNEEKLIATLKKLARKEKDKERKAEIRKAIVKVEAIDEQLLESLIYNGVIEADDIQECTESKVTYTLRLSKNKK